LKPLRYYIDKLALPRLTGAEIAYFLAVPVFMALISSWFKMVTATGPINLGIPVFWVVFLVSSWLIHWLGCQIAYLVLKPYRPPLWVILIVGTLWINILTLGPIQDALRLVQAIIPDALPRAPPGSWDGFRTLLPGFALWFGVNYFYDRVLSMPRFSYKSLEEPPADSNVKEPEFLQDIPDDKRGRLIAIQAQEHYLNIATDKGTALVHYSFGRAVDELAGFVEGVRVHRSFWVALAAVSELVRDGRAYRIRLSNGEDVPVSRTYLNDTKRALESYTSSHKGE